MSIRAGRLVGLSLFFFLSFIFLGTFNLQAQSAGQSAIGEQGGMRSLIVQPVDESKLAVLKGNTHPLARAQYDQGAAPLDLPMNRMLLVLKRSDAQETTLRKLLDDQQDKSSASYHKWVTPEVFGKQYGPSDQDIQTVTGWLQMHGFQLGEVAKGRNIIEFSGTAGQVQEAFHTAIHKYSVNGEEHWANAIDPAIPAALSTVVSGVDSLHNFRKKAMNSFAGTFLKSKETGRLVPVNPQLTFTGGCTPSGNCYGVVPYDFATIYNVLPLWNLGIDGTGQTIAIVGRTNINPQDVTDFRAFFGLPVNPPNIILNGPDPGINGDEAEADIDVQWSGGVAKNATIDFVTSESTETTDGIDLSALYIVDNNLAPVMSESYGLCELALGTSGNAFFATLWEQAASQGISVFISSGDNGAAGCDDPANVTQDGLNVNGIASTPFNVAVGGTDFNEYNKWSTYWSSTNNFKTQESAIGYIPETAWNDSCANPLFITLGYGATVEAACNNAQLPSGLLNSTGGSGGPSNCIVNSQTLGSCSPLGYAKPSWQSGAGVPNDNVRDLPDISLFASNGFLGSSYLICQTDAGGTCSQGFFLGYGGTSVASPAFAGIMALVNQKMQAPQGNPNFALYKLASQQPNAFHDVPAGSTIAMPCLASTGNCTVNNPAHSLGILSGYGTGAGYDLATGLGSVDANNLVNKWSTVTFTATTTSLTLSPVSITHGQPVNLNIGVSPSGPTGAVSLLVDIGPGNIAGPAIDVFSLTGNSVSAKTNLLPGGTNYKVFAHYSGDGIFGGSYSAPVSVTVSKENSNVNFPGLLTGVDGSGNPLYSTSVAYGSAYALRVDILNSTKAFCNPPPFGEVACPTGNVALTDNGSPLDLGTYVLNSQGYTEDQLIQLTGGSHTLVAQYAGDNSYVASSGSSTVSVTPAGTTTSFQITGSVQVGGTLTAVATVNTQSLGLAPSGTVTFFANGTAITGTVSYVGQAGSSVSAASLTANFFAPNFPTTAGTYNITASYSGDQNYAGSTSPATAVVIKYPAPGLSIQSSPSSVAAGASVTLTALVVTTHPQPTPTGTVLFNGASSGAISGTVTYTPVVDNNGNNDLQAVLTFVPAGSDTFSAQYSGDTNYPTVQGVATGVTVTGTGFVIDFPGQNSVTVTRGQTAQLSLGVVMQSGAAPVTFSSTPCKGLPTEAACGIVPSSVSGTATVQINIKATAPHAQLKMPGNFRQTEWLAASVSTVFAGILLLGGPQKRRRWTTLLSLAVFAALLTLPACGGGSNSGGGGGGGGQSDPGTPVGTSTVTVTATSGTAIQTTTFTLVVQ